MYALHKHLTEYKIKSGTGKFNFTGIRKTTRPRERPGPCRY